MSTLNIPADKRRVYRPDIDGLRALAVMAVLLFHAKLGCPGGYVGVDVFFVISGYLITQIIIRHIDEDRFKLTEFFERRANRILPAGIIVVFVTLIAGYFILLPSDYSELGRSAAAQAIHLSNYHYWSLSGYFDQAAEMKPLLHTWSLAVEMQFYLLFPLLIILIHKTARSSMMIVLALGFVLSLALSEYCSHNHPSVNYYFLPTRAWQLLLGSLLACAPISWGTASKRWRETAAWTGVFGIMLAVFGYDESTRFPGISALLPTLGAAAIIWANSVGQTSLGRILSFRAVVFIGLISYSLYLWHWPMLVYANYSSFDGLSTGTRVLLLMLCIILSIISWRYIEIPFRGHRLLSNKKIAYGIAAVSTLSLLAAGAAVYAKQGLPSRLPEAAFRYSNGYQDDYKRVQELSYTVGLPEILDGNLIQLGQSADKAPVDLLLWGDSHAVSVISVLDAICTERGLRGAAAVYAATLPLVGYENKISFSMGKDSIAYSDSVINYIRNNQIKDVLLVARWGGHGTLEYRQEKLFETITAVQDTGARVWLMKTVPLPGRNVPRALAIATLNGTALHEIGVPVDEFRNAGLTWGTIFENAQKKFTDIQIIDPMDVFTVKNNIIQISADGEALYCDESHLSTPGAMMLKPLFEQIWTQK